MNEQDRTELARLKEQQARLQDQLNLLSGQLKVLERRLTDSQSPKPGIPPLLPVTESKPGVSAPIVERQSIARLDSATAAQTAPPLIPPLISPPSLPTPPK